MNPGPESLTSCGTLWRAIGCPKKPLQAGRPQIIRLSDVDIIGWSDVGDHQWSDLRSQIIIRLALLTGADWSDGVDAERNDDEKDDWKKFQHARA